MINSPEHFSQIDQFIDFCFDQTKDVAFNYYVSPYPIQDKSSNSAVVEFFQGKEWNRISIEKFIVTFGDEADFAFYSMGKDALLHFTPFILKFCISKFYCENFPSFSILHSIYFNEKYFTGDGVKFIDVSKLFFTRDQILSIALAEIFYLKSRDQLCEHDSLYFLPNLLNQELR